MKALIATLALVLAACGSGSATVPPSVAPASSASASAAPSAAGPAILPIIISSEITKGPNRWLFSLTDRANNLIAAPEVPVHLEFYNVDAAKDTVAFEADARFLWAIEGEAACMPRPSSTPKPAAGGPASPRCWQTAGAPTGPADR